jgi:outer membrane protein assembly factor BamB
MPAACGECRTLPEPITGVFRCLDGAPISPEPNPATCERALQEPCRPGTAVRRSIAACHVRTERRRRPTGGGGSGDAGGGDPGGGNHYPLTLSTAPANLSATLVQGVSQPFTVTAQVAGTISTGGTVYVVFDDTSGVLQADKLQVTQSQNSSTAYVAQLVTSTTLAVGEDKGTINVKVCADLACGTVYGETNLPYDFTVASSSNITSIATLTGVSDWQTERGSASQANYLPITLDPSGFTIRWLQTNMEQLVPAGYVAGGWLVTDSTDRIVVIEVPASYDPGTSGEAVGGFAAYSETDGSPLWHEVLTDSSGTQQQAGPLAASGGTLYTTQGPQIGAQYGGNVTFTGLSAETGAVVFQTPIADTFNIQVTANAGCGPGAPLVAGSVVLVNPGCMPDSAYGSLGATPIAAFDGTTGQSLWTGVPQGGSVGTSIASDGSDSYYIVPRATGSPTLTSLNQTNGSTQWQSTLADGVGYEYATPALDGSGGAVLVANTQNGPLVDRYALTSGQLDWQITIPPQQLAAGVQAMAVANGTAYLAYGEGIVSGGLNPTVAALNLSDGSTAWSWSPPASASFGVTIGDLIVTNNLLFVSTTNAIYAVDLSTHQAVWTLAVPGGSMAISPSGTLYVVTAVENYLNSGLYTSSGEALLAVNLH